MPRRVLSGVLLAALVLLAGLWLGGGFDRLAAEALGAQRGFQEEIAATLRRLRGGEPGALGLLLAACFAYGFFHAIGPGHGKLLVGGYGLGRSVGALRLGAIALVSSLGQAASAIALVYGGLWLWGMTREAMVGTAERVMAPASYGAIVLIGLWLLVRGGRRLLGTGNAHDHAHTGDAAACSTCGHRHGPSPDEIAAAGSLREAAVLVAGIALRPCTGALFVLLITWQMGIALAGILGTVAMALGTALVTISVAVAASGARGGLLRGLAGAPALVWVMPVLEVAAGAVIVLLAGGLLLRAL